MFSMFSNAHFSENIEMENKYIHSESTQNKCITQIHLGEEEWLKIIQNLPQSSINSLLSTCKRLENLTEMSSRTQFMSRDLNTCALGKSVQTSAHLNPRQEFIISCSPGGVPSHPSPQCSGSNGSFSGHYSNSLIPNHPQNNFGSNLTYLKMDNSVTSIANNFLSTSSNRNNIHPETTVTSHVTISQNCLDTYSSLSTLATAAVAMAFSNPESNVTSTTMTNQVNSKVTSFNMPANAPSTFIKDTRPSPTIDQTPKRLAATAAVQAKDYQPHSSPTLQPNSFTTASASKRSRYSPAFPMEIYASPTESVARSELSKNENNKPDCMDTNYMLDRSRIFKTEYIDSKVLTHDDRAFAEFVHRDIPLPGDIGQSENDYRCRPNEKSIDDYEAARRDKRRERNRVAAAKCRQNRQNQIETLEKKVNTLKFTRDEMHVNLVGLQKERTNLEEAIRKHAIDGCSAANLFIQNTGSVRASIRNDQFPVGQTDLSFSTQKYSTKAENGELSILNEQQVLSKLNSLNTFVLSSEVERLQKEGISDACSKSHYSQLPLGISLVVLSSPGYTASDKPPIQSLVTLPSVPRINIDPSSNTDNKKAFIDDTMLAYQQQMVNNKSSLLPDLLTPTISQEATRPSSLKLCVGREFDLSQQLDSLRKFGVLNSPSLALNGTGDLSAILTPCTEKWLENEIGKSLFSPQINKINANKVALNSDTASSTDNFTSPE